MANELFSKEDLAKIVSAATSNADLSKLANEKSVALCEKIQEATSLLNAVKDQVKDVSDSKKSGSSLLGMAGKLAGLAMTGAKGANSGIELNNLVQSAIGAITSSPNFAQIMQKVLSGYLTSGFTGSNGKPQTLSTSSASSVNTILSAITSYLKTAK